MVMIQFPLCFSAYHSRSISPSQPFPCTLAPLGGSCYRTRCQETISATLMQESRFSVSDTFLSSHHRKTPLDTEVRVSTSPPRRNVRSRSNSHRVMCSGRSCKHFAYV